MQLHTRVLLKLFWIIVLLFSFLISAAQHGGNPNGSPRGLPHTYGKGWYRNAYFQADSGLIFPTRDTAWLPRFKGTVVRQEMASDTSYWEWDGVRWKKFGGSSGGVISEADPTVPIWVKSISQSDIRRWDSSYNNIITSLSFDTSDGSLLAFKENATTLIADIDGRYLLISDTSDRWQPKGNYITSFTEVDPTVPFWVKQITQGTNENQYLRWNGIYYEPKQIDYSEISNPPSIPTASDDIRNNILVQQNAGFWVSQPSRIDNRLTLGGPLAQYNSAVAPSSPANGWEYYNTTLNSFQDYVNGSWRTRLYTDGAVWAQTAVVQNTGFRIGQPSTIEVNSLGTGSTTYNGRVLASGLTLVNTTAATASVQQNSPTLRWIGQMYVGSVSQPIEWGADVVSLGGSGAGTWRLSMSGNSGAWAERFTVNESGHAKSARFMGPYISDPANYANSNLAILNENSSSGNSTGTSLVLSSTGVNFRVISRGSGTLSANANNSASHWIIGQMTLSESTVGTHPVLASFSVKSSTITNGVAETALASTLYIEGAPTGITPTNGSWAIFAGAAGHSGNIGTTGDIELTDATKGIIMKASGTTTRYRVTLNSTGTAFIFTSL